MRVAQPGGWVDLSIPTNTIYALLGPNGAGKGTTILVLTERLRGIVKEYLAAPIPRFSILMGNATSTMTKSLFQAIVILIVGVLIGAKLGPNPLGWLGGLVLVALFGLGFGPVDGLPDRQPWRLSQHDHGL